MPLEKPNIVFKRLNHIQICIPKNTEAEAKEFYCGILGLEEMEKPEFMKKNGGFWLKIVDIELHIGTEDVINKSKRHPAFEVEKLDAIVTNLESHNVPVKWYKSLPGFRRLSIFDPFNNRIELLEDKSTEELHFLGKEVQVKVDRPLGSKHPEHEYVYPINYGFVPNTKGGDEKEVDAYIIGEDQVLDNFQGQVKAVIVRYDDDENKLVVAKSDVELDLQTIREATAFQEKYFDISIRMLGE